MIIGLHKELENNLLYELAPLPFFPPGSGVFVPQEQG